MKNTERNFSAKYKMGEENPNWAGRFNLKTLDEVQSIEVRNKKIKKITIFMRNFSIRLNELCD